MNRKLPTIPDYTRLSSKRSRSSFETMAPSRLLSTASTNWCTAGPSSQLSRLVSSIKGPSNAFHLASDETANTFTVQSPPSILIVQREAKRIAEDTERIAGEAKRDEIIKSENSRAECDPKPIAN